MKNQVISVIIPIYNTKTALPRCIESVINQTYKDIEIILVDDGSTDGSSEICDSYAEKFENIRVIHKENGGLSSARNEGIEVAKGRFLAFVDSDDYVHKDFLKALYSNLIEYDAHISECEYLCVDDKSTALDNSTRDVKIFDGTEAIKGFLNNNSVESVACNKLYKKEIFDDIRYPYGRIHEDEFVIHHVLFKCKRLVHTTEYLYYYCRHSNSIIGRKYDEKRFDYFDALLDRIDFLENVGMHEEADSQRHLFERSYIRIYNEVLADNYGLRNILKNGYSQYISCNPSVAIPPQLPNVDISQYDILPDAKIGIYGAGIYGMRFYEELRNNGYNVVGWYANDFYKHKNVLPLDRLTNADMDVLIVAIKNPIIQKRVQEDLRRWQIKYKRLICI